MYAIPRRNVKLERIGALNVFRLTVSNDHGRYSSVP